MSEANKKINLAIARSERLKLAKDQAEKLLEQKSRELYVANKELEMAQLGLEDQVREATKELSQANSKLQKTLDERAAFIGQMSHEVRTPLNAVMGLSEVLLTTDLDEVQTDYLSTIKNAAYSLVTLLEDMLDISKIDAGKMELHFEVLETSRFFNNISSMFRFDAEEKGLSLNLDVSDDLPEMLKLDKGRFRQIVNNLVSNAVKNTESGAILIKVEYEKGLRGQTFGNLTVRVMDTGVGIPEQNLGTIFDAYKQLGSTGKGVGLGLAICSQLVELMNGQISCRSKLGEGSEFIVKIPAEILSENHVNKKTSRSSRDTGDVNLKILVAEDNPTNQTVLKAQLAQLGQTAEFVDNGMKAIRKLRSNSYDVVFLDIIMPVMDGEETIQVIRGSNEQVAKQYCVALTASNYSNQRERLLAMGFDDFLSKPLSIAALADTLNSIVPGCNTSAKAATSKNQSENSMAFDVSYLQSQFGDFWETIFVDVAPTFISHTDENLGELKAAVSNENIDRISRISHSLKGGASSIGLNDFSAQLARLEKDPTAADVEKLFTSIATDWVTIRQGLKNELNRLGH
ncbi:MAG: ATP-binding protein [Gammaproteobacteria bacterium]|nr:ATP-binding protein [Gammaproteobacteria bacterium]